MSDSHAAIRRAVSAVYNQTCRHCGSEITNYGGIYFTTIGAVCSRSPDTQHRPIMSRERAS
jgi:hypothetical protein